MPFSAGTYSRVWRFVTQFARGEAAERSDFDTAFDDVIDSVQDGYDALDARITTNTTNIATNVTAIATKAASSDLAAVVVKMGWKNRGTTSPWHADYKIQIGSNWYSPDPLLVVAGGQSNALGNTSATGGDKTTNSNVFAWDWDQEEWVLATLGSVPFRIAAGNPNSFTFHACKNLSNHYQRPVLLIQRPIAGSAIGTWRESLSGENWERLEEDISAAVAAGGSYLYTKTKADVFLWHQGEAEFDYSPKWLLTDSIYPEFVEQVLGAPWAAPDMRMVAGEMLRQEDGGTAFGASEAWRRLVSSGRYPRLGLWSSAGLSDTGDGIHFDGASLVQAGRRAADVVIDLGAGIKSPALDVASDADDVLLINERPHRLIAEMAFDSAATYNQTVTVPVARAGIEVAFDVDGTITVVTSNSSNASLTLTAASAMLVKVWFPSEVMWDEPPGLTVSKATGEGTMRSIRFGRDINLSSIYLSGHVSLRGKLVRSDLPRGLTTLRIINCPKFNVDLRGTDIPAGITTLSFAGTPVHSEFPAEVAAENTARGSTITSLTAGFTQGYHDASFFASVSELTTAAGDGLSRPNGAPAFIMDATNDRAWLLMADASATAVSGVTPAGWTQVALGGERLFLRERATDPANPTEGESVIWQSNGAGAGDDGDIMVKITAGGVTKTATLVDFSAV